MRGVEDVIGREEIVLKRARNVRRGRIFGGLELGIIFPAVMSQRCYFAVAFEKIVVPRRALVPAVVVMIPVFGQVKTCSFVGEHIVRVVPSRVGMIPRSVNMKHCPAVTYLPAVDRYRGNAYVVQQGGIKRGIRRADRRPVEQGACNGIFFGRILRKSVLVLGYNTIVGIIYQRDNIIVERERFFNVVHVVIDRGKRRRVFSFDTLPVGGEKRGIARSVVVAVALVIADIDRVYNVVADAVFIAVFGWDKVRRGGNGAFAVIFAEIEFVHTDGFLEHIEKG